ncbi:cyclin-dependent kinase 5 activator 1-like, partial [Astyanax mexicanus]
KELMYFYISTMTISQLIKVTLSKRKTQPKKEGKKTTKKSMKRSALQLSPAPLAVKKQKIQVSSPASALTHEMVLDNVCTAELLYLLGEFLCRRCRNVGRLTPWVSTSWLCTVDMLLVVSRRQRKPFLCPGSVVFLYMLCRDCVSAEVSSKKELCAELLICFYISCSYIGTKLGYRARSFMLGSDGQEFWKRTLDITKRMSHKMLQINISPQFFAQVLADLKNRTDS